MEYMSLGRTGLKVSRLCLGTMNFGPLTSAAESHAIMDHAHQLGINLFDTANNYGGPGSPPNRVARSESAHLGWTEEIIGDWFSKGNGRRDRTILATKVYGAMGEWPNQGGLSALNIVRACNASLRRLRTDYIDLYQMHHIDRDTSWEEIWQAMQALISQGKIIYVGSSNFAGWHITQANAAAAARGLLGLVSEQSIYNLLTRDVELEVLPAAASQGIGVLAFSPLHNGLLGGALQAAGEGKRRAGAWAQELLNANRSKIEAYEALCKSIGAHPAIVAVAWLLRQAPVTAPVIGPRTIGQLDLLHEAVDLALGADTLDELGAIFPGYRPAPEHYAW